MNTIQNEYSALQTEDSAHETVGTSLCAAWKVAPGTIWVQVRTPELARKLKQVSGYREVAWSLLGGYLRTFEFRKSLAWARSWIDRHTAANEAFSDLEASTSDDHLGTGMLPTSISTGRSDANLTTLLQPEVEVERMAA